MTNGGPQTDGARRGVVRFHVFVLRDPRDGSVFMVGRGRSSDGRRAPSVEDITSSDTTLMGRVRAITDDGHRVERLILVDDLASEPEAATVQQAVLSAYEAVQLSPTTLVSAAHHSPPAGSFRSLPEVDAFDDPHVRQFVANSAAEIDRLAVRLSQTQADLAAAQSAGFLDGDHRHRLESLILEQEAEISRLNATLDRVRALVDLSQWAGRAVGTDAGSTVRIDDLSRALD
jgi:hypothetical protein